MDRGREEQVTTIPTRRRRIGRWGTVTRVVGGAAGGIAALLTGADRGDALLGLVLVPAAVAMAVRLRGRHTLPLRLYGPNACCVLIGVGFAFFAINPQAAWLFFAESTLLAAARGYAGCEVLAVPNWLLARDDQVACPVFTPIDRLEARARGELNDAATGATRCQPS